MADKATELINVVNITQKGQYTILKIYGNLEAEFLKINII
jgi:hypothetical protein